MVLASAGAFLSGDGSVAARIAELDNQPSGRLGDVSLPEFYNALSTTVAVTASGMDDQLDAARTVHLSLQAQRERISGVNLDEEAISMIKFERAFQGASRFVRVVDDMISELVSLIR
jgi:flagellar hook-associated protein 1 FlgK